MKKIKKNESGRSMVEMLGVLAIIGVLSVGGIAGYKMAMDKILMNKISILFEEMMLALDVAADTENSIFDEYLTNIYGTTQPASYYNRLCGLYIDKSFCPKYMSGLGGQQMWEGMRWGTRNINAKLIQMSFITKPSICQMVLKHIRDNKPTYEGYYAGFSWHSSKAYLIYGPEDPADGNSNYMQTGSLFEKTDSFINNFCNSSTNKNSDGTVGFQLFFYK